MHVFFKKKSWSSSLCRILSWPDLEKKMPCYLRSSFKSLPSSKRASVKIALDRADAARRVLFAPAAVVIGLVPVGSAASRGGDGETGYLPGEAHFTCLSGFPPSRPTTVWLGTYWPWLIFPDLLKRGKKIVKCKALTRSLFKVLNMNKNFWSCPENLDFSHLFFNMGSHRRDLAVATGAAAARARSPGAVKCSQSEAEVSCLPLTSCAHIPVI